jgi:pilus assembly protein CpaB
LSAEAASVRKGSFVILIVAIVMGGSAALLARAWLLGQARATNVAPVAVTRTIVVAAVPLQFGSVLSDDKLAEIPWAADTTPPGAFATKQELLKEGRRVALAPIELHEPVLSSKVTAAGERGSLSTLLGGGKRAVTVQVDDVRGVAGFIQPNDRVDVVLIRTGANGGQGYSDLLLQNIKVLAIDKLVGEQVQQASINVKVVTLEVTPEEAQKLLLATNVGRLSLILRRQVGEADASGGRRITERDLAETPEPAPPPPVQSNSSTIVIMRGAKRDEYSVKHY